uniref:ShKT domain-containing protein n=1 Tax=Rhabditophanes sp. KR3021 TaxID=114890 RepID=A0AC35TH88_9BILA
MVSCKLVLVILLAVAPYSVMSQAAAGAVCDATITCAATLACNEKPPADTPTGTFVCSKACTVNTDCVAPATCTPGTLAPVKSTCNLSALPTNGCKVACVSPLVCNTANLQCEAATTTTTTTVATTTTTVACSDIARKLGYLLNLIHLYLANCAALKAQGLCTDAKYLALMSSDCASTCGTCGSVGSVTTTTSATSCVDTLSSTTTTCTAMASLCNSGAYKEFMLSVSSNDPL